MASGKAPGVDGLPMEFYLKFWDALGADLVEVLNCCLSRGYLAKSRQRGVISLTFKKGDRLDPHNWRPITLLCVDYKIASRAIAGRLLKVIHFVVDQCQTCGVPGRFIGDSVGLGMWLVMPLPLILLFCYSLVGPGKGFQQGGLVLSSCHFGYDGF